MQFDTIISIYVRHALTFFDSFMKMQGPEGKCKDEKENARTKRKMQGQKGKCKDDIKSYFLDRFEQIERSKNLFSQTHLRFFLKLQL